MKDAVDNLEESQEEVKGLGETLREKRQSLGLEIDDIAKKLHLKPTLIADIESEQYDPALSVTFTKGYIRLYSKHLGLNPDEVLALFDSHESLEKQPTKLRSFSQKVAKQASDARLMMVTYIIIAVVIGLLIMWWVQQSSESPSTAKEYIQETSNVDNTPEEARQDDATAMNNDVTQYEQEPAVEPLATGATIDEVVQDSTDDDVLAEQPIDNQVAADYVPAEQVVSGSESAVAVTAEVNPESSAQNSESEEVSLDTPQDTGSSFDTEMVDEPEVTTESLSTSLQTSQASLSDSEIGSENMLSELDSVEPQRVELIFHFSGDCWMNLTDATGEVIAYGVKEEGYVMPVSGVPPFEVVLGAPSVVAITVDGEAFDMSPFPAGRTARFMIGEEE